MADTPTPLPAAATPSATAAMSSFALSRSPSTAPRLRSESVSVTERPSAEAWAWKQGRVNRAFRRRLLRLERGLRSIAYYPAADSPKPSGRIRLQPGTLILDGAEALRRTHWPQQEPQWPPQASVDTLMAIVAPRRTFFLRFESAVLCCRWLEQLRTIVNQGQGAGTGHWDRAVAVAKKGGRVGEDAGSNSEPRERRPTNVPEASFAKIVRQVRHGLEVLVGQEGGQPPVEYHPELNADEMRRAARLERLSAEARDFAVPLGKDVYEPAFTERPFYPVSLWHAVAVL